MQVWLNIKWDQYVFTQPTFQRRNDVISTLWISVKITLIRRWKWNKTRRHIISITQRWYSVGVRCWNNIETTLYNVVSTFFQCWYNIISILFQPGLSYIVTNLAGNKYGFVDRLISFILINGKIFFTVC